MTQGDSSLKGQTFYIKQSFPVHDYEAENRALAASSVEYPPARASSAMRTHASLIPYFLVEQDIAFPAS